MQEVWKKIEGYPLYSVSNFGQIRNDKTNKILKGGPDTYGYPIVILCNNGQKRTRTVHRIVAEAFIPNPQNKPQVNHIDGDKKNNCISNLEWVTNQENSDHFWRVLDCKEHRAKLSRVHKGKGLLSDNPRATSVRRIEDGRIFGTIKEAAAACGVTYTHIGSACRGYRKSAGGYHWEFYKEESGCSHR